MRTSLTLAVAAVALGALAGCTSPAPAPSTSAPADSTASSVDSTSTPDNHEPCLYLAGGALEDAIDFSIAYTTDRESVSADDASDIITDFEFARDGATGELAAGLDQALTELNAVQERYTSGSEVDPAVDYQSLHDGLDLALTACGG